MKAIIIGAGRGRRLMPTTADTPKCFADIGGRRILDWTVEAFTSNGINDICFIGGYQIDKVRQAYPHFTFRHNKDWEHNNILASFMHAEDQMDEPFICCYSDILFTPEVVRLLLESPADMSLVVDTAWRDRYTHRPRNRRRRGVRHRGRPRTPASFPSRCVVAPVRWWVPREVRTPPWASRRTARAACSRSRLASRSDSPGSDSTRSRSRRCRWRRARRAVAARRTPRARGAT